MRFTAQVALVAGSASGIGLATAMRLASEGANLVLADIDADGIAETERCMLAQGWKGVFCSPCDVADEDQVRQTIDSAIGRFGRLDVVVNSAGVAVIKPLDEQTAGDWQRNLGVDLLGSFFFIKHAFRVMTHGGAIVNVASVQALESEPWAAIYAAAKSAVLSLTRSASIEGKPRGIRVNAVLPGAVDTPMMWSNQNLKSWAQKIQLNDVARPEDMAAAIAFLASSDAAAIQGACLRADEGGLSRL